MLTRAPDYSDGEKTGSTEELKAQDQMKWVRLMINIKSSVEEIVVKNTIYM